MHCCTKLIISSRLSLPCLALPCPALPYHPSSSSTSSYLAAPYLSFPTLVLQYRPSPNFSHFLHHLRTEVAAIKEGEELPSGGNKGSKKVFGVIGGSQLTTLLSSCSTELAVIAGALLDILSVPLQTTHTSSSKGDDVSVIMACSCVRWLVVAFPGPLLGAADTPGQGQITPKKGKKTAGADTSNRVKFSAILRDVTTAMTSSVQSLMSPQSKAHHTQLLVSVINQPDLSPLGDSLVLCRNVIPDLLRKYISVFVSDPYSIANVWAILGESVSAVR